MLTRWAGSGRGRARVEGVRRLGSARSSQDQMKKKKWKHCNPPLSCPRWDGGGSSSGKQPRTMRPLPLPGPRHTAKPPHAPHQCRSIGNKEKTEKKKRGVCRGELGRVLPFRTSRTTSTITTSTTSTTRITCTGTTSTTSTTISFSSSSSWS